MASNTLYKHYGWKTSRKVNRRLYAGGARYRLDSFGFIYKSWFITIKYPKGRSRWPTLSFSYCDGIIPTFFTGVNETKSAYEILGDKAKNESQIGNNKGRICPAFTRPIRCYSDSCRVKCDM